MNNLKGFLCALASGVTFGLIPLFTLPLMAAGLGYNSIISYRFLLAAVIIGLVMLIQKKSFYIRRADILPLFVLSLFYDGSTYFLIWGYEYVASGVASAIQFLYTVFVVLIMLFFFKEQKTISMFVSIILGVLGVALLSVGDGGSGANLFGVFIVLVSAVSYALYIVMVNNSNMKYIDDLKLTFYVLLLGGVLFLLCGLFSKSGLQAPKGGVVISNLALLALIATVIPNITLVYAIKNVGSIIASIMGALSPVTAVFIGILVFKERLTDAILLGLVFVFLSVFIIMFARPIDGKLKGIINKLFGHLGVKLK